MYPTARFQRLFFLSLPLAILPAFVESMWIGIAIAWGLLGVVAAIDAGALLTASVRTTLNAADAIGVGGTLKVELKHQTRASYRPRARIRLDVGTGLAPTASGTIKLSKHTAQTLLVDALRRGVSSLDILWCEVFGPLGMFSRIRKTQLGRNVRVTPNHALVRSLALTNFSTLLRSGAHLQRQLGEGGDFDTLAAYQPGASARTIDWKHSARHQSLLIRRYRVERNQGVVMAFDVGRLMQEPIEGLTRCDHNAHAALLLSRIALAAGDQVGIAAYGAQTESWLKPRQGKRHMAAIARNVANLRPRAEESNHVLGLHTVMSRLSRRSLIIVFSDFADSTGAEFLIDTMAHLTRKHMVIFVSLNNPALIKEAQHASNDANSVATALLAGQLIQDRRKVLRRIRRMGISVVDAPPGRSPVRLVDEYVRIKKRGLIG